MVPDINPPIDLTRYRQFFAEEIQACAGIRTAALAQAFACVPRERFLPPGPWVMRGEADFGGPPRQTPDADPRHVYHNVVVAIDPARQLFNGQPATLAVWIDALALRRGARVLHVGAGLGYYTAIFAETVGRDGRVLAIEVDEALARQARTNLQSYDCVEVRHGDAASALDERFDAILVNAGVTHPRDEWLDALAPGGRLVLPLTVVMPPGASIGKGIVALITNDRAGGAMSARLLTLVAIYTAQSIRDESIAALLGKALARGMMPALTVLRRDAHDPSPSCWLHASTFCLGSS